MTTIEMARAEGRAEERAETNSKAATALKVQLAARFRVAVPADVEALVDSATIDQLLTWMTIAANAKTLDEVFPNRRK
jgi:hypothetical protein